MEKRGYSRKPTIFLKKNCRGQAWIETVIYTLIAFVMIGLILSYAKPKIEQLQDNAIIKQSIEIMKQIDSTILNMGGAGNQRILEIGIKKGTLKIDGENDKIIFEMKSKSEYSEFNKSINDGAVVILTQKKSGYNLVTLTTDYSSNNDLEFEGKDISKEITSASTSYKLSLSNEGEDPNDKTVINILLG